MKRHHTLLASAILTVALSGCAVLVQYGDPQVEAVAAVPLSELYEFDLVAPAP